MGFKIKVTDRNGYPVKQYRVNIEWKGGGQSQSQTDDNGVAEFTGSGGIASSIKVVDKQVGGGEKIDYDSYIIVEYNG